MKNVITKFCPYKNIGLFNYIYILDVNYNFNEKSIEEIINWVKDEPFFDVLIYTNHITTDITILLEKLSEFKKIWLQSDEILFEDIGVLSNEDIMRSGIDKIEVMIDGLGDMIDVKKSLNEKSFVKYNDIELPF